MNFFITTKNKHEKYKKKLKIFYKLTIIFKTEMNFLVIFTYSKNRKKKILYIHI